jgi:hypothetical protein
LLHFGAVEHHPWPVYVQARLYVAKKTSPLFNA